MNRDDLTFGNNDHVDACGIECFPQVSRRLLIGDQDLNAVKRGDVGERPFA